MEGATRSLDYSSVQDLCFGVYLGFMVSCEGGGGSEAAGTAFSAFSRMLFSSALANVFTRSYSPL